MKEPGKVTTQGYTFHRSADGIRTPQGKPKQTFTGVTMVTAPKFAPTLTELLPIDGRFLTATFNTAQAPLKFIATYSPHNEIEYNIRQKYYDQLTKLVADTPNSTNLILLGDLNAQIHEQTLANQNITGPHGQQPTHTQLQQDGEDPNNAELLHQLCEAPTMCFPQTWMQKTTEQVHTHTKDHRATQSILTT